MELIGLKDNWYYLVDEEEVCTGDHRSRRSHSHPHYRLPHIHDVIDDRQGLLGKLWKEMLESVHNIMGDRLPGPVSVLKTLWMGPDALYTFFL